MKRRKQLEGVCYRLVRVSGQGETAKSLWRDGCWNGGRIRAIKGESAYGGEAETIRYHSESTILTTLFTLLMWPILFTPHPGAFETPYQTAPLDLGEDTFASTRREAFEARLEEISNTETALEYLKEVDERERDKGTWAVGVNWEFGREDLREVVLCLGGKGLSGACRMLGEEYRYRVGGVPDLL
jgi:Fanconi-associated nuclease 1